MTLRRLFTRILLVTTGAAVAAALPAPAQASARLGKTASGQAAAAGGTLRLAAKKKKKKGAKRPASSGGGAAPADDDDKGGGDDATASGGGASDAEVQRAARVAPAADSGGSEGDAPASRSKSKRASASTEEGISSSASSAPSEPSGLRFLDVAIGGNAFARSLTYNQAAQQGDLREYQPKLLGGAAASIVYYPGAQFSNGFVTNIGLEINVNQAFGVTSKTPDMTSYSTSIHDYNGGVRWRVPLDNLEPSVTLGFGDNAYTFSGAGRDALLLPDVHYQYVRGVVGLLVGLPSNLSAFVGGGYRHVLSAGQIKDTYFKDLSVAGVEATAYVAYAITPMIEARAGFDLRRYFYALHAKNGDTYIIGGAVDQTLSGTLSLAVTLGGSERAHGGGGSRSSEEASPAAAPSSSSDEGGDGEVRAKPKKRKHVDME